MAAFLVGADGFGLRAANSSSTSRSRELWSTGPVPVVMQEAHEMRLAAIGVDPVPELLLEHVFVDVDLADPHLDRHGRDEQARVGSAERVHRGECHLELDRPLGDSRRRDVVGCERGKPSVVELVGNVACPSPPRDRERGDFPSYERVGPRAAPDSTTGG